MLCRKWILLVFLPTCSASCGSALPSKDPCFDSLYMALRFHPPDSLTAAQQYYLATKDSECREYLDRKNHEHGPSDATTGSTVGLIAELLLFAIVVGVIGFIGALHE